MDYRNSLTRSALALLIASLILETSAERAVAQPQDFNSDLFTALDHFRGAGRQSTAALERLQTVMAERQQRLQTLVTRDPAAALTSALPDDMRAGLPLQLQPFIERHVKLRGEIQVAIEDGTEYSRTHYSLRVDGRRVGLHFADHPPGSLTAGDRVQVEGVQAGQELALTSGGISTTAAAATSIVPNSFGDQKTLVILVNFQDLAAQPYTPQQAYSTTFTTVSNWIRNNSFQQTWLSGDVAGWYTIPVSSTTCDVGAIATYGAAAAQKAGFVLGNYAHRVYAFPQISACSWWGLSDVGGNPSSSWINGSYQLKVVGHELGHGFGLYHSHSLSCGSLVYGVSGCSASEYGDTLDIMGNPTSDDLTASQKELLGWLNYGAQPPVTTVATDGTYMLAPVETQDSLPKALKIAGPNGTYYYVESRQAIGDDISLAGNTNVLTGVVLHSYTPGMPNSSYLLNATPGGSWSYPALVVGKSYTDMNTGVTIAPITVSSSGAAVKITHGPTTCTHISPSIFEIGPYASVASGVAANFTVKVTNRDSAVCGPSNFALESTVPSGWTAAFSATSITLAPGVGASVILRVTAPLGTPNGTYKIGTKTYNLTAPAYSAVTSASETIYTPAPVVVTVASSQTSYTAGQTLALNVSVTSGTAPASGTNVTVSMTKSDGSLASLSGTTGSNGLVTLGYQTRKNDPKGVWQAKATSGNSSGTTAFTLQ